MAAVSPARKAAFAILLAVEQGQWPLGRSASRQERRGSLTAADRNLTTALVLGVLRWQIDLDRRIRPLLKHPNAKLDAEVLIALRLGAFQLLHLDRIPAHAAIDESVELTKQAGHRFASGMVNAVLRKIAGSGADGRRVGSSLTAEAYPEWMVERWAGFYGEDARSPSAVRARTRPCSRLRYRGPAVEEELATRASGWSPASFCGCTRCRIRRCDHNCGIPRRTAAVAGRGIATDCRTCAAGKHDSGLLRCSRWQDPDPR